MNRVDGYTLNIQFNDAIHSVFTIVRLILTQLMNYEELRSSLASPAYVEYAG